MFFTDLWGNFSSSGDSLPELMQDLERHLTNVMEKTSKVPEDFYEHMEAFITAINWQEPWIIGLLCVHTLLFLLVVLFRKYYGVQSLLFMIICSMIALSEIINSYCADHWRLFSSQNYFDKHGVFAGVFFSGPLLIIGFTQLIIFLVETSSLLIQVKRMELARNRKQKQNQNGKDDGSNDNNIVAGGENSSSASLQVTTNVGTTAASSLLTDTSNNQLKNRKKNIK